MPQRSLYSEAFTSCLEQAVIYGMIQGAGAAPPVVAPITFSATSSKGFMPRTVNWVSLTSGDITRGGVGVYTVKLVDGLPYVIDIAANVMGAAGSWATVQDYNPTTRVITVTTFAAAGAAYELTATDFLRFTITGSQTIPNP